MLLADNAMKGTATTFASSRNKVALFAGTSSSQGDVTMAGETTHTSLTAVVAAVFLTLSVQAALAFQKYRFNNGLMLGTTLAALNWYEDTARRNALPRSRLALILIATTAAVLTVVLQQAARVFATGVPQTITLS
jgi:hypothetical protein